MNTESTPNKNETVKINRQYKGQNLVELLPEYVALDLETTGLDPTYDEIIEVCAVHYKNGRRRERYCSLVKPSHEIDSFVTSFTGITNKMLEYAPTLDEVLPELLAFIGDNVLVAHNANYDINFIYDAVERAQLGHFTNNFVDTLRISRLLFNDLKSHQMSTLVSYLGIRQHPTHRADDICLATAACYEYMKRYVDKNNIDISSAATAVADTSDNSHPLFGKICVFTGALSIPRKEAMQLVESVGGINGKGVSKTTNYLIIGSYDYCTNMISGKSEKQKKAEAYILEGQDITILSESTFLDLIGDAQI